jgi:hypothetical protein
MNPEQHISREGERIASHAIFHMVRATSKKHIRIREDNCTREIVDELLFQLNPESDLWAQIRSNRDQRDEVMTGQQIDLDMWERYMRGQGFQTGREIPKDTTTQGSVVSKPPESGGPSTHPESDKPEPITIGQERLLDQIIGGSQHAEIEWKKYKEQYDIGRLADLSKDQATPLIDHLKAVAGWEDKPKPSRY